MLKALKSSEVDLYLVFMTVLTQISLGGFFVLFLGDVISVFGYESANWMIVLLVMLPAVFGLVPIVIKNLKTFYLAREILILMLFVSLMFMVIVLYLIEVHIILRLLVEAITLAVGIYGIYEQSMLYRMKTHPSWNREMTHIKFFGVAYVGIFLVAFFALVFSMNDIVISLLVMGTLGALAQMFFTFEDLSILDAQTKHEYQLKRTKRLYDKNFHKVKLFRFISIIFGGIVLALIAIILVAQESITWASISLLVSLILVFASELSDRFLFYATVVPLGREDGLFIAKQRD